MTYLFWVIVTTFVFYVCWAERLAAKERAAAKQRALQSEREMLAAQERDAM